MGINLFGILILLGFAAVPLIGLLLICWGLWGDRSKGRTRCPKCWYDLRGTLPLLVCPECGHDAMGEDRLYQDHRRWGLVVLGVLLLVCSGLVSLLFVAVGLQEVVAP